MDGYFWAVLAVGVASTLVCVAAGAKGYGPNDITILSVAAVELTLLVYLGGSIVSAVAGGGPAGPAWEFWGYLLTALVIPFAAVYWSLLERSRWSNFVLAAVGLVALVMTARMNQLWYGPDLMNALGWPG
ncbi:hypothetical protein [Arthrobacter castelli]|uniref:hypothetical protein n=1 Tax=Arthrobacter castelli TaxID=271431 RepID=UPI0003FCC0F0|nr:hypothetical protein [Arthrobacter castelli]